MPEICAELEVGCFNPGNAFRELGLRL